MLEKFVPFDFLSDKRYIQLQRAYGNPRLKPVLGGGKTNRPKWVFVFMHPTDRNISVFKTWKEPPLPWLGTRTAFIFIFKLGLLTHRSLDLILSTNRTDYTYAIAEQIYLDLSNHRTFIAEYVPVTTRGSKPLPSAAYHKAHPLFIKLLQEITPEFVFLLGARISSHFLNTPRGISQIDGEVFRDSKVPKTKFVPTYYPVGQGTFNQAKAISTIKRFIKL